MYVHLQHVFFVCFGMQGYDILFDCFVYMCASVPCFVRLSFQCFLDFAQLDIKSILQTANFSILC